MKRLEKVFEDYGGDPVAVMDNVTLNIDVTNSIALLKKSVEKSKLKYAEERFSEWYYGNMLEDIYG